MSELTNISNVVIDYWKRKVVLLVLLVIKWLVECIEYGLVIYLRVIDD